MLLDPDKIVRAENVIQYRQKKEDKRNKSDRDNRKRKLESQLESVKAAACKTEAEAAPATVTATEPAPPHPLLQKPDATRVSTIYKLIVDGSLKKVYKEYFVENQTPKASETFLDAVEGCKNVVKILVWKKCLKLTPELEEMFKSISKSNILSKANSDRAQALICHYFPTHYSMALPTRASETWREWKSANGSKKVMSQETSPPTTPTVCLKPTPLPTLRITPHIAEHSCD